MSTAMSNGNEQQPIAVVGATTGQSTTDVEKDLDQFLDLLRAVRDRLPRPDHMTWKVVYEDAALQASQYAGRMSSCLLTAKVRKYVRYAAPRLVIGEHDDVVITILLEGSSSVLSPLVGAKAQERLQERLDRHEASKQTKVDLRRAAIQRTKQRLREGGIVGTSAVVGRNAAGAEIIEEVEEIEEIVEEEEEEPEEDDGAREQKVGDSAAPVAAPPPAEGSDDTEGAEDDVPPPPGPPPPLADSGDQDEPPPPTDESSDWDAPPPPPPPPLVDAAGDWDDVPPPPPPLNEDGDEPPPPPPPLAGGDDDDDWDPPPPPPPE